jgi:DNA-binding beta-propeller fold protein YncE
VIDAREGIVLGTADLGGAPEQAVSDGEGAIYVNLSDKPRIAVVDAEHLRVRSFIDVPGKVALGSGLALDAKNHVLFAYYRASPPVAVILNAGTGRVIATLPTGPRVDTVAFNPNTMEAVSAEGVGSMTFIKEQSPTSFVVEQRLDTKLDAKTLALDSRTNRVFTMAPAFRPPPPDAPPPMPGRRPPRGPMVPGSFTLLMIGR